MTLHVRHHGDIPLRPNRPLKVLQLRILLIGQSSSQGEASLLNNSIQLLYVGPFSYNYNLSKGYEAVFSPYTHFQKAAI